MKAGERHHLKTNEFAVRLARGTEMVATHRDRFMIGALAVAWRGKKLSEDPDYQQRLVDGLIKAAEAKAAEKANSPAARGSRRRGTP